jgi:hypothetical protein
METPSAGEPRQAQAVPLDLSRGLSVGARVSCSVIAGLLWSPLVCMAGPVAIRVGQFLVKWGPTAYALYDQFFASEDQHEVATGFEGRKVHLVFDRHGAGNVQEDVAVCTLHLVNLTDGELDDTWTTGDYLAAETALHDFWFAIRGLYTVSTRLREYRWYRFNPSQPFAGAPLRVGTEDNTGTNGGAELPPQVAISVTEKTSRRKSWGRFYLPAPAYTTLAADGGVIGADALNTIHSAALAMYRALVAADLHPVVYSKPRARALAVQRIQVDDLYDVVRSRRWDRPTTRIDQPVATS